jgi:hypothetical protein
VRYGKPRRSRRGGCHSRSADDVTEDEVETTDAVLAGLAYQYAADRSRHVAVIVSDRLAEQAIADVLAAMGLEETTAVVEGRAFLTELRAEAHDP